jgi:oxygen-independent coproporphyrinogen-3 oxidase
VASTEEYVQLVQAGLAAGIDHRRLPLEERLGDALFTGLRLTAGVNLDEIRAKYGVDVWARYGSELEPFLRSGLLQRDGARLWLTRQGMLLAHEVMATFV